MWIIKHMLPLISSGGYDYLLGFSGDSDVKESSCSVGDLGSISELGRSPGEGKGYPLQYSGLENSMDCIVHDVAESDTTEQLSLSLGFPSLFCLCRDCPLYIMYWLSSTFHPRDLPESPICKEFRHVVESLLKMLLSSCLSCIPLTSSSVKPLSFLLRLLQEFPN